MEHALIQQCPACHWVLDADGRFLLAIGDSAPIFGKPPAELQGARLSEFMPEDQRDVWMTRIRRSMAGQTLVLRERNAETLFGVLCFPLRVPENGTTYSGGYALNITVVGTAETEQ